MIAQIEHIRAVKNLSSILNVAGLDGILVGPYDLSASMGLTGHFDSENFNPLCKKYFKFAKHKKPAGLHVVHPNLSELNLRIEEGYQLMAYSIDAVFLNESASNFSKKSNKTPNVGHPINEITFMKNVFRQKIILNLVDKKKPIIFDVGAHKGESVEFFKKFIQNHKYIHLNQTKITLEY